MPKTKNDQLDAVVNIRIEMELLKDLELIAKENGIARSALMRLILRSYTKRKGKKTVKLGCD